MNDLINVTDLPCPTPGILAPIVSALVAVSDEHTQALGESSTVFEDHEENVIHFDFRAARTLREASAKDQIPGWPTLDNVR